MRSTAAEEGRAIRVALARRMTRRARGTGQTVGLRSLLAKTLRDARLSITLALGLLGTLVVAGGLTMATTYGTAAARADLARLSAAMPAEPLMPSATARQTGGATGGTLLNKPCTQAKRTAKNTLTAASTASQVSPDLA